VERNEEVAYAELYAAFDELVLPKTLACKCPENLPATASIDVYVEARRDKQISFGYIGKQEVDVTKWLRIHLLAETRLPAAHDGRHVYIQEALRKNVLDEHIFDFAEMLIRILDDLPEQGQTQRHSVTFWCEAGKHRSVAWAWLFVLLLLYLNQDVRLYIRSGLDRKCSYNSGRTCHHCKGNQSLEPRKFLMFCLDAISKTMTSVAGQLAHRGYPLFNHTTRSTVTTGYKSSAARGTELIIDRLQNYVQFIRMYYPDHER
jgi:hypothetical protein